MTQLLKRRLRDHIAIPPGNVAHGKASTYLPSSMLQFPRCWHPGAHAFACVLAKAFLACPSKLSANASSAIPVDVRSTALVIGDNHPSCTLRMITLLCMLLEYCTPISTAVLCTSLSHVSSCGVHRCMTTGLQVHESNSRVWISHVRPVRVHRNLMQLQTHIGQHWMVPD
jgi:hypothetical protein